ncbi:UvrD-helicase domain-containing protein [Derxia gummosa]|uniref:ATP-dependent DNA helicase Rep n=1 Tax=Derxia gummosa DSM 723 TaxID=1121388 RepID=A0A8B6X542_9BURK|nr:UvrD-helicase domain-containing protein [Derxia gummosa]
MSSFPLNAPQQDAVNTIDRPCLVLAGAGSGKTRVITAKIAHLIGSGYEARQIAALTFTNKAASEMKERADGLLKTEGKSARGLVVSTFHSLGVRLLRAEGEHIGLKPSFSILDSSDAYGILQEALATTDKKQIKAVQNQISLWKNGLVDPDAANDAARSEEEIIAARAFRSYDATLRAYQAVDFDDLIRLPVRLFTEHHDRLVHWQGRLRYLLVDEYQDTNACQYALMKLLARRPGSAGAFTAVGDDDQSIYAWRGASIENITQLEKDWPQLKVIKLEQNYRSSQRILAAANSVISHNPKVYEKKLWSDHGLGDPISLKVYETDEDEAKEIALRLIGHKFERRATFRDYAVLYRSNHQARVIEQALRNEKIPYVLSGGQSFFERAEIKDLTSYLRLMANGDDDPAFIRAITTPKRGIGPTTLEALGAYAGERKVSMFEAAFLPGAHDRLGRKLDDIRDFGEFINRVTYRAERETGEEAVGALVLELLKAIEYEAWLYDQHDQRAAQNKWSNVLEFVEWIKKRAAEDEFHKPRTLIEVAQTVALISMMDNKDSEADAVRLSTLHASKGLEYPHVFLVGVEEGLLPHTRPDDAGEDEAEGVARIEEERRLMYVGITRAQRSLHVSLCRRRKRGRGKQSQAINCEPSRFINEMGLDAPQQQRKPEEKPDSRAMFANLKAMLGK